MFMKNNAKVASRVSCSEIGVIYFRKLFKANYSVLEELSVR